MPTETETVTVKYVSDREGIPEKGTIKELPYRKARRFVQLGYCVIIENKPQENPETNPVEKPEKETKPKAKAGRPKGSTKKDKPKEKPQKESLKDDEEVNDGISK